MTMRRLWLLLTAALAAGALWRRREPLAAAGLAVDQAWAHNLRVMERRCRQMVPWTAILAEFAETVQYDDVEAHKACERARRRGCRACTRRDGQPGCLNRAGTRCCDGALKRCVNLS